MTTSTAVMQTPGGRAGMALAFTVVVALGLMLVLGDAAYLWLKALHVVAVISWMAGMVYLPRLFVYHADAVPGGEASETFKVMERRLLQIIMTPAMVISWGLGLWLGWQAGYLTDGWFHVKLLAVIGLTAAHGHLGASVRRFANDENEKSSRYWRMMNEVPTVLMIAAPTRVVVSVR